MHNDNDLGFGLNIKYDGRDIFQQLADIGRGEPKRKSWIEMIKENAHKRLCERLAEEYNRAQEIKVRGENPNPVFYIIKDFDLTEPKSDGQSPNNIITYVTKNFNPSKLLQKITGWIKR